LLVFWISHRPFDVDCRVWDLRGLPGDGNDTTAVSPSSVYSMDTIEDRPVYAPSLAVLDDNETFVTLSTDFEFGASSCQIERTASGGESGSAVSIVSSAPAQINLGSMGHASFRRSIAPGSKKSMFVYTRGTTRGSPSIEFYDFYRNVSVTRALPDSAKSASVMTFTSDSKFLVVTDGEFLSVFDGTSVERIEDVVANPREIRVEGYASSWGLTALPGNRPIVAVGCEKSPSPSLPSDSPGDSESDSSDSEIEQLEVWVLVDVQTGEVLAEEANESWPRSLWKLLVDHWRPA